MFCALPPIYPGSRSGAIDLAQPINGDILDYWTAAVCPLDTEVDLQPSATGDNTMHLSLWRSLTCAPLLSFSNELVLNLPICRPRGQCFGNLIMRLGSGD